MILILLMLITGAAPLDLYNNAMNSFESGNYDDAAIYLSELADRMPHKPRLIYNFALAVFSNEEYHLADSLIASLDVDRINEDSLLSAQAATILARGIEEENYQAVAASADILKDICVNQPAENDIWNLETALDWLRDHEPPEPESENSQDEGEGEDEQQQDETDDAGEGDSENTDDQQDNEPEQDQEDSESDERDNENQDAEQESNREEQLEDLLDEFQNREQEMTQEAARAILDMVTEADLADSTRGSRVLDISGQDW